MSEQTLKLEDDRGAFGAAVRRRWWLVAVGAVVLAVVGLAAGALSPASYTATSTILVKPVPGLPFSPTTATSTTGQNVTMTTESALVLDDAVLRSVNSKLGTHITANDGSVTATVPANTQTIQIGYTAGSAAKAQQGADTIAQAFLAYRAAQATAVTQLKTETLQKQIAQSQTQLNDASKLASAAVPLPQAAGLVQLYSSTLVTLQQSLSENQATSLDPGSLIAPAVLPASTATLLTAGYAGAGLVLGALIGMGAAVLVAMRDRRLRGEETAVGGLPVLASSSAGDDDVVDRVRTAILAGAPLPTAVGILSTDTASATSLTSSLGDALADAGYRVAVIEADPESSSFETGLGELLTGTGHASTATVRRNGVLTLPAGRELGSCADLLTGPRMAQVVSDLRADSDVVLVALPSARSTLGLAVARFADETVLVAPVKRTSSDTVTDLVRQADLLGVRLLGLVLGSPRARAAARRSTTSGPTTSDEQPSTSEPQAVSAR